MKYNAALSIPPQLLAAAFAGFLISAVCILAVIGVIAILRIILPENRKQESGNGNQEESR